MKSDILIEKSYSSRNLFLSQQRFCIANAKVKKTFNVSCIIQREGTDRRGKTRTDKVREGKEGRIGHKREIFHNENNQPLV